MAYGVIAHFEPLSLSKFFDPSTPSMREGRDGEREKKENNDENIGPLTSLPVDRLNGCRLRLQRRRSCQLEFKYKVHSKHKVYS